MGLGLNRAVGNKADSAHCSFFLDSIQSKITKKIKLIIDKIIYGISNDIIRDEIGRIEREVAVETEVNVIDLYAVTENHPEYFTDGLHPNKEGYAVVARTVYEQITKDNF